MKTADNIITVRDANNTYTAKFRDKKTSCTAGASASAQRVASIVLGIPKDSVKLKPLPYRRQFYYLFLVENL